MEHDPLQSARLAFELSTGLCLIVAIAPGHRVKRALARVREALPEDRPTVWHTLDGDGVDLSAAARAAGEGAALLVHGLERMVTVERELALGLLNVTRDRLGPARAAVVLFVPDDLVEEFTRHCPDLYAWRAAVVRFTADDLPAPEAETTRTRWLLALIRSLDYIEPPPWWREEGRRRMTMRRFFIEPEVELPGERREGLFAWADRVKLGLLCGPRGSGRRTALMALAWRAALRALEDPAAPVPVVVASSAQIDANGLAHEVQARATEWDLHGVDLKALLDNCIIFVDRVLLGFGGTRTASDALRSARRRLGIHAIFCAGALNEGAQGWEPAHLTSWSAAQVAQWQLAGQGSVLWPVSPLIDAEAEQAPIDGRDACDPANPRGPETIPWLAPMEWEFIRRPQMLMYHSVHILRSPAPTLTRRIRVTIANLHEVVNESIERLGLLALSMRCTGEVAAPAVPIGWYTWHVEVQPPQELIDALPPDHWFHWHANEFTMLQLDVFTSDDGVLDTDGLQLRIAFPILQDWFAANGAHEVGQPFVLDLIRARVDDPSWRDLIRFLHGLCVGAELGRERLAAVLAPDADPLGIPTRLALALECADEAELPLPAGWIQAATQLISAPDTADELRTRLRAALRDQ